MSPTSRVPAQEPQPARQHQRPSRAARVVRWSVLFAVWGLMTYVTVAHQRLGGGPEGAPTVDALCPFGGLSTLYRVCAGGGYLQRVFPSSVVLLVGLLVSALIVRRAFCGWVCPLGAMQELFGVIGRRLKTRRSLLTSPADRSGRYLKYATLVLIITLTWATGTLVFRPYDPWAAYAHLSAGWAELRDEFLIGFALLVITVVGSLVLERSWCRYLCPLGGLLGAVCKAGATRVVRSETSCIHCGRCDRACPVDISVQSVSEVRSGECLTCGDCVAVCPVPQTLGMKIGRRPISVLSVGLLAVAIFFGTVAGAKVLGLWESRPQSLTQIVGTGAAKNPANIRGFMTLSDIASLFELRPEALVQAAGLSPDTPLDKPIKDVMKPLGRETDEVREVVSGLLSGSAAPAAAPAVPATPTPTSAAPEPDIAGTDTLSDIEQRYQLSVGTLLAELKLPADTPRDRPLKDIMRPLGRHVTEVRQVVARLTGKKPTPASK